METTTRDPNTFARELFDGLPRPVRRAGGGAFLRPEPAVAPRDGPSHRRRRRPGSCSTSRPAPRALRSRSRSGLRLASSVLDLTPAMLRRGIDRVQQPTARDRVRLVVGPGRAASVSRRDVRRAHVHVPASLCRRPRGDPARARPGGEAGRERSRASSSRSRRTAFWRFWWWGYTRLVLPVAGYVDRRACLVRRRTVPRPEHLRALPALSGRVDRRGVAASGSRGRRVRRMSLGGGLVMWARKPARDRAARPSTPRGPAAGATGGRSCTRRTRRGIFRTSSSARRSRRGSTAAGSRRRCSRSSRGRHRRARARRVARPAAAHAYPGRCPRRRGRGRARAARSRSASPASTRVGPGLARVHRARAGPRARLQPRALRRASLHSDIGFAAAWGAFPVLTALLRAGRAARPHGVARGGLCVRAVARAAVPEHPGAHRAPAHRCRRRDDDDGPTGRSGVRRARSAGPPRALLAMDGGGDGGPRRGDAPSPASGEHSAVASIVSGCR